MYADENRRVVNKSPRLITSFNKQRLSQRYCIVAQYTRPSSIKLQVEYKGEQVGYVWPVFVRRNSTELSIVSSKLSGRRRLAW